MSKLVVLALLLLPLINHGTGLATAWDDKDFFRYCPPSQCSQHGPEIRFPFQLESSNASSSCGQLPCAMKLACSGQDTILVHPGLGPYNVSTIDYRRSAMKIIPFVDPCLLVQQKLISRSIEVHVAKDEWYSPCMVWSSNATLVCCSTEFTPDAADRIVGPVSCLSNRTHFLYYVDVYQDISLLPLDCKVVPNGNVLIPMYNNDSIVHVYRQQTFKESVERMLNFAETTVYWDHYCSHCELDGHRCAFSSQRNQSFCIGAGIISNCHNALGSTRVPNYTYFIAILVIL